MYLIYKILKEIRYIMRSKSMKRLITLALLIVLLSMLCSRVFAIDSDIVYNEDFPDKIVFFTDSGGNSFNSVNCNLIIIQDRYGYNVFFFPKETVIDPYCVVDNLTDNSGKTMVNVYSNSFTTEDVYFYSCYFKKSGNDYVYKDSKYYYQISKGTSLNITLNVGFVYPSSIVYSSMPIYNSLQSSIRNCQVYLSTEEETDGSIHLYTNDFSNNLAQYYNVSIITNAGSNSALTIAMDTENPTSGNSSFYRYGFDITSNGTYAVVFTLSFDDYTDTQTITKIISNITSGDNTGGGIERRRRNRRRRE